MELDEKSPSYIFKICLVGDSAVGKTCIARRLCYNTFSLNTQLTVGIDFYKYDMPTIVKGEQNFVRLLIWDFGGQEHFKTLFDYYINGANGIFLIFDLLRLDSLMKLDWWYNKLIDRNLNNCPKFLIGTKLDLVEKENKQNIVDRLIIEQFLKRHNEKDYIATSSKDNTNIIKSFKELVKKVLDLNKLNYEKIV